MKVSRLVFQLRFLRFVLYETIAFCFRLSFRCALKNKTELVEAATVWEKKHIQMKTSVELRSLVGLYDFICMFVCTKRGSPQKAGSMSLCKSP